MDVKDSLDGFLDLANDSALRVLMLLALSMPRSIITTAFATVTRCGPTIS